MTVRIEIGDCLKVLRGLPECLRVNCCVTSPPYFGLRDYGHAGQIGLETSPTEYVAKLVEVFREVRRVLQDDGTLWLNLGDSYVSAGGLHDGRDDNQQGVGAKRIWRDGSGRADGVVDERGQRNRNGTTVNGIAPKNLIGIPWRVAFALQSDGWYLRSDIIWHKPNPMPESVTDRPTKAHEYLFLLSKSARYYYDAAAIAEIAKYPGDTRHLRTDTRKAIDPFCSDNGSRAATGTPTGESINRRTVWTVPTSPYSGAHFATFPPALIEPCILAGCPEGGTVLDPFGGAGTTGLVADRHHRNALLIELNPEYAAMAKNRIHDDAPLFSAVT